MKKLIATFMCLFLVCAFPTVAFAEGEDFTTEKIVTESVIDTTAEEIVTEEVYGGTETMPELTTEVIVKWVTDNYEEITVILAVIAAALLIVQRLTMVIKSIISCNNNAAVIAEESKATTQAALDEVKSISTVVDAYREEFANLLAEVRQTDEEKRNLKTALESVEDFLKKSKSANIELGNTLAELLCLANIPNSKKEELYSRHRAAVEAIDSVVTAVKGTEVNADDGNET
jgi:hypothetical protein